MDESAKPNDLENGLIDVSFEDDCLINSSFTSPLWPPHSENQEKRNVRFLEPFEAVEISFNTPDEKKEESQPLESSESRKTRSGFKYNLRKSLAWDNAFFTSEGVLEPEELSSMIGGTEKSEKHVLPGIQEDVQKSSDSLSTLDSDSLTLKSLELDLFEDIRASIQKSCKSSIAANSNDKKSGERESQIMQSSKKVDTASQDKMTPRIASRKPSVGTQGSGKATKLVSVHPQASQSVVANGGSTSSPGKPPKASSRTSSISTISTKRASMGTNHIKLEKYNSKNAGRGAPASTIPSGGSQNIASRPRPPSRSAFHSSAATKNELTTSCSSFGSSGSASSDSVGKISSNTMRKKHDSGTRNPSSSSTAKSLSRTTPRSKSKSGGSHLKASLGSVTKHASNLSPASSISEWSSESTASTSTANQRHISTRVSQDSSSSKGVSIDNDASQGLDSHSSSTDQCPVGNDAKVPSSKGECVKGASRGAEALLCSTSIRPSGLRIPSPKIGFFDGVRSAGRTPNGSRQTHPSIPIALPKIGAGSFSPSGSGGSNKAKLGKLQPARTSLAVRSTKSDAQQNATTIKSRSPLALRESSIAAKRVSNISKNVKSPLVSPRVQGGMTPKIGGDSVLKAEKVGSRGHEISAPDSDLAEKNGSPRVLKHKVSPEHNGRAHVSGSKFSPVNEGLKASSNVSSTPDAENINPSQKVGEDAKFDKQSLNLKNELGSLHNLKEKERAQFEDQVNGLTRQVGAMDMNLQVEKKVPSPTLEKILTAHV